MEYARKLASATDHLRIALVLLASLQAAPGWAQQRDGESGFFEELPVVLSASRLPQPLSEAPGAVTVLSRDFIRATGYRDIGRLFRLVPGFNVVHDRAHTSALNYHGLTSSFASNKMQVLIDGRSVYSNYFAGGVDWGGLPITIDEIDRIEIVRGSSSATYGSNAFLGVVNIITRHSAEDEGAMVGLRTGNRNQFDAAVRLGMRANDVSFRVSVEHGSDSGFENLYDSRRNSIATVRADYRLSPQSEITFGAGANSSLRGLGYPNDFGNEIRNADSLQDFVHLRWRYTPGPDEEWSAGYYHNTEYARERLPFVLGPGLVLFANFDRKAHRDNIDFQHYFRPTKDLRLLWGGEARREEVLSRIFFSGSPGRSTTVGRLFSNAEWRAADPLLINVGGLYEKFEGESGRLAPRLFANWQAAPGHTLRAGVLRAYREPSLWEHFGQLKGDGDNFVIRPGQGVRPERVDTRELGYLGALPWFGAMVDLRAYRERISRMVYVRELDSGEGVSDNRPDAVVIKGLEWQLKARPMESADLIWSHALTRIDSRDRDLEASAPPYTSTLTWLQRYPRGFASTVSVINVGPVEWLDSRRVKSYTTWDARLAWRFNLGRGIHELSAGMINGGPPHDEWRLGRSANPVDRFWYLALRTELN